MYWSRDMQYKGEYCFGEKYSVKCFQMSAGNWTSEDIITEPLPLEVISPMTRRAEIRMDTPICGLFREETILYS